MSRPVFILALFATLAAGLAIAATSAPATRPAPRETAASWDKYQIITTRNIFLRDRSRYRSGGTYSPPMRPLSDEDSIVLTGIVQQGLECVAFFENMATGQTMRTPVGQPLGRGALAWICLESVGYQSGSGTRTITVGQTLSGQSASLLPPPSAGNSPGQMPTTIPAAASTGRPESDETGDLAGDTASPTSRPAETAAKPGNSANKTPAESTGGSNLSAEERMRLKRQQELRQ